jgi:hypothetical protein
MPTSATLNASQQNSSSNSTASDTIAWTYSRHRSGRLGVGVGMRVVRRVSCNANWMLHAWASMTTIADGVRTRLSPCSPAHG